MNTSRWQRLHASQVLNASNITLKVQRARSEVSPRFNVSTSGTPGYALSRSYSRSFKIGSASRDRNTREIETEDIVGHDSGLAHEDNGASGYGEENFLENSSETSILVGNASRVSSPLSPP